MKSKSKRDNIYKVFFLIIITCTSCEECGYCKIYRNIFEIEIESNVIKKYSAFSKANGSRVTSHVVVKNINDSIIDLDWMEGYSDLIQKSDSIYKEPYSLVLKLYHNGSFVQDIDLNCNCSYVKDAIR